MELALAFIGAPVATYLCLAALPKGRPALIGIVVAAIAAAMVWVRQMTSNDTYFTALITFVVSAIALAALVQIIRVMLGQGWPRWVYPLIVLLALLGAGIPMISLLGM